MLSGLTGLGADRGKSLAVHGLRGLGISSKHTHWYISTQTGILVVQAFLGYAVEAENDLVG